MDETGGDGLELRTTMGQLTGDIQKDMKMLMNFVFNQTEEMRYLLDNLDVTNFNDLGLARYENGRMQLYTEKLDIKTEELTVALEEEIEGLGQWVAEIEVTAAGLSSTVAGHTSSINTLNNTTIPSLRSNISQNASKIGLVVQQTNGQNTINAAAIALSINNAGSNAMISADQISMSGTVKFLSAADVGENGSTEIDGGRIKTGTIQGVELISESGIKSVKIANGSISFNYGGLIQNNNLRDLVIQCDADMRLGSAGGGAVYISSYGQTWELKENGWEKV